ncbi:hypothetical protein [Streptomyces sp. NEAU-NA10]|uniref:hypothetical protein n=1 Tax=Streptomyces sp. NEAU-NA10 TaxID=3416050 RepID=UPI003CC6A172
MKIARPWFEDLEDSVRALGEAAREYQLAYAAARTLSASVEYERRRLDHGKAAGARPNAVPAACEPHADAVFDLVNVYRDHEFKVHALYERAALVFASGCAWAVKTVREGGNPNGVLLPLGDDHRLMPGLFEIRGLERYARGKQVAGAYERLMTCLDAGAVAEDLDAQEYLADHEAGQLHEALDVAMSTADAAYAYGLLAEGAVRFSLLEPRRQYARRQVEEATQA